MRRSCRGTVKIIELRMSKGEKPLSFLVIPSLQNAENGQKDATRRPVDRNLIGLWSLLFWGVFVMCGLTIPGRSTSSRGILAVITQNGGVDRHRDHCADQDARGDQCRPGRSISDDRLDLNQEQLAEDNPLSRLSDLDDTPGRTGTLHSISTQHKQSANQASHQQDEGGRFGDRQQLILR